MAEMHLITGATGYIGSQLVRFLLGTGESVAVLVRDEAKARRMFDDTVHILAADIADTASMRRIDLPIGQLVHCAATTKSAEMASHPVETADGIVLGTRNVLELARRCHARSMVFLSSMEVYGSLDTPAGTRTTEDCMGAIDILQPRSSYPLGKRMAEQYCSAYAQEYGVPVKIARLAQTFGSGVPREESRVFAQFARSALQGEDIVLHTRGQSVGNYCSIDDVIDAIVFLLAHGKNGEAYNVVNEANTMRIKDMAEVALQTLGNGRSHIVYDIPESNAYGYAPDTGLRLSGGKLANLGWCATKTLADMYRDIAKTWQMETGS